MSNIDKCCLNCTYFKVGWCDLYEIVPYPPDKIDCANFAPKPNKIWRVTENKKIVKQTVFEKITESEETLAEKLVYFKERIFPDDFWGSTLFFRQSFYSKEEAIAATVEELKKEYKEKKNE